MTIIIFTVGDAIRKINPNARYELTSDGRVDDVDSATIEWIEGTTPISKEDIKTQIPIIEQEVAAAATKHTTDKASADAKLKALGLTDDEIEAFRN